MAPSTSLLVILAGLLVAVFLHGTIGMVVIAIGIVGLALNLFNSRR